MSFSEEQEHRRDYQRKHLLDEARHKLEILLNAGAVTGPDELQVQETIDRLKARSDQLVRKWD